MAINDVLETAVGYGPSRAVQVPSTSTGWLEVHFDDALKAATRELGPRVKKVLRAVVGYGYIGSSAGGRNGIALVTDHDGNIAARAAGFLHSDSCARMRASYNLKGQLKPVKVVIHDKSGTRVVGCMDEQAKVAVLYGIENYRK